MDPPTPEIYTYLHTLPPHDALPICFLFLTGGGAGGTTTRLPPEPGIQDRARGICVCIAITRGVKTRPARGFLVLRRGGRLRSEEHTSDLQSLMRISYAVFCLYKKINHTSRTRRY